MAEAEIKPSNAQAADRRSLTTQEALILDLLKKGKRNKVIAYELGLRESTVNAHVRTILKKLGAKNRTEAVSIALQTLLLFVLLLPKLTH
jgi:DNA-binding NarL/FixJ family response regulator